MAAPIAFSEEESNVLLAMLEKLKEEFTRQENTEFSALISSISTKVAQATMAGRDIPDEVRVTLLRSMDDAVKAGDGDRLERAFSRYLVVTAKLSPDPTKALVGEVMTYLRTTQNSVISNSYLGVLALVRAKVDVLLRDSEGNQDAVELLTYLKAWVTAGQASIKAGGVPWAEDTDVFPDGPPGP